MPENTEVVIYQHYCLPGVKRVLASGGSAFIGEIDDSTVLKYPLSPKGDMSRLDVERKLLQTIGQHERIIQLKGFSDKGLYLERALNGNLYQYLVESENPLPPMRQRLSWCREAAEAVSVVHAKRIIHCDIQPANLLLDGELHVKLSDFQGKLLSHDGTVLLDGWSSEPTRFYRPRADHSDANVQTDLFALGCTIYFIIKGHAVFPDIQNEDDQWHEKVQKKFEKHQFPNDLPVFADLVRKCWIGEYKSSEELLAEMAAVEAAQGETF
ncbi:kinase-like protein [Colletotrichum caudatum]|nr:kinase-like protein [Colletotrichum caudatum]